MRFTSFALRSEHGRAASWRAKAMESKRRRRHILKKLRYATVSIYTIEYRNIPETPRQRTLLGLTGRHRISATRVVRGTTDREVWDSVPTGHMQRINANRQRKT